MHCCIRGSYLFLFLFPYCAANRYMMMMMLMMQMMIMCDMSRPTLFAFYTRRLGMQLVKRNKRADISLRFEQGHWRRAGVLMGCAELGRAPRPAASESTESGPVCFPFSSAEKRRKVVMKVKEAGKRAAHLLLL
jgi:hypothetical protein